jgi:hypothetical protein
MELTISVLHFASLAPKKRQKSLKTGEKQVGSTLPRSESG